MSAQDQIRAMLDQLMGTGRDGENNKYKVKFDDPRVCKSFLLGCCPHDILASTRMDLGECPKIHDLALKADYEMASKNKDYYYDIDAMEHLQSFIADCDRRTELSKRRLKETQEELSEEANAKAEVIHQLGEQIGTKLAKAEEVGAEGNVDESLKAMQEVDDLKKKKAQAEIEYRNSMPASSYQQQKLRVCEVCSAYLGIHDNDRRLADHFGGKLHLGFINIREKLAELQAKVEATPHDATLRNVQERRMAREREREERRREREDAERRRSRSRSSERERERDRDRDRDRGERRDRDRDRDRDRHRRRSRSRSKSRSRSRDRRRRRTRSRSRDRRRRSRSRSRDRRRRSRSRERRSRSNSRRSKSRRSRSNSRSRRRRRSRSRSRRRTRSKSRSRSRSKSKRSRRSRSKEKTEKSKSRSRSRSEEGPPVPEPEKEEKENGAASVGEEA